jgi:adenylyltransferase/sulfurtransferase
VPGTVGNFAALMAIRAIVGIGEDAAGAIHLLDGLRLSWRTIRVPADPECRACGAGSDA